MKPVLVSSGEASGVGPDICLALAGYSYPLVVLGDKEVLAARAEKLGRCIVFHDYQTGCMPVMKPNHLTILSIPVAVSVIPGVLNSQNASYVITQLTTLVDRCLAGEFAAMVTAPVHKAIINQAGIAFTGHTEFFATRCKQSTVVMMLASSQMNVALVTTHLPLREVADAITETRLMNVIHCLHHSFQRDFGIHDPRIAVAGLNPHAGEGGCLGHEEQAIIIPTLEKLKQMNINVHGPLSADTLFTAHQLPLYDVCLAMYHDQGLPVIKYADFKSAVNVSLGLPVIRTSVDHGTALNLAGTGQADPSSLFAAVDMAVLMHKNRERHVSY